LNKRKKKAFDSYDEYLLDVLGSQGGVVLEQARLREVYIEQKRMQAEMELAAIIQKRLLPANAPEIKGLEVAGISKPSSETGGDYFDYLPLQDGSVQAGPVSRLGVVVGDVTGHGVGAALIMTAARAMIRSQALTGILPDAILKHTNNMLEQDLDAEQFLSLCYGVFDMKAKTFVYTSAGHEPPLVYRPANQTWMKLDSTGTLLGLFPELEFPMADPLPLISGEIFLFFTDGLFEAMNKDSEQFGIDRVKQLVANNASRSAREILDHLMVGVEAFTEGLPQRDDITLLVVKYSDR